MKEGYTTKDEAEKFGLRYIVERSVRPYDTATLNYNWQVWNTKAFSFYTNTTEHISKSGDRVEAGTPLANTAVIKMLGDE